MKCRVASEIAAFPIQTGVGSPTVQGMKGNDMKEDNKNWLMRLGEKFFTMCCRVGELMVPKTSTFVWPLKCEFVNF